MAAGYDKNGEVPDALLGLGFGFAEIGTITPLPQAGNPKPRIFRLTADEAVINRLGFNNEGHARCRAAACRARRAAPASSASISAPTRTAPTASPTTNAACKRLRRYASYLTVNISSPNTPGLRNMQARDELAELLSRVMAARAAAASARPRRSS